MKYTSRSRPSFLLLLIALALPFSGIWADEAGQGNAKSERPRKIFAHYMGCFPAGTGPIFFHQFKDKSEREGFRHNSKGDMTRKGGRFKTWPLVPDMTKALNGVEAADIEIRRAIRAGINGFAIDTWAGGQSAKDSLNNLFAAAEAGQYPFEVTICIDPWSMPGGSRFEAYKEAVNYMLEKHRKSPNLARRDGKPLIFTYQGQGIAAGAKIPSLATPEGQDALIGLYKQVEEAAGEPLYFYFDFSELLQGAKAIPKKSSSKTILEAAPKLAGYFGAIGNFIDLNTVTRSKELMQGMSEAVRANGAEWAPAVWYQYHNIGWHTEGGVFGISKLRETWERAINQNATLIQFATWNDYGEHTSLAPTRATNYGMEGVNRYFSDWWKSGKPPEIKEDQIFIFYRPSIGGKAFPFSGGGGSKEIQVVTLLTAPGKVRVGNAEQEAGAGMTELRFEAPVGYAQAEIVRDGKVVQSLKTREFITDHPYRADPTWYSVSSNDEKYWKEDYPDHPYPQDNFYGDDDNDGLPNWFEMYWFGKWRDFSTATDADPNADPDEDGMTNLQEYLAKTDPTQKPPYYDPGFVWDLAESIPGKIKANPQKDSKESEVWFYRWDSQPKEADLIKHEKYQPMVYPHPHAIGFFNNGTCSSSIAWNKSRFDKEKTVLRIRPPVGKAETHGVALLEWVSPVDGVVTVRSRILERNGGFSSISHFHILNQKREILHDTELTSNKGEPVHMEIDIPVVVENIPVKKGEKLYIGMFGKHGAALGELKVELVSNQAKKP